MLHAYDIRSRLFSASLGEAFTQERSLFLLTGNERIIIAANEESCRGQLKLRMQAVSFAINSRAHGVINISYVCTIVLVGGLLTRSTKSPLFLADGKPRLSIRSTA